MNLNRAALLVIDMQNGYCHERGFMNRIGLDYRSSAAVIGPVRRLVTAARSAGIPIFFTRYCFDPDYADAGLLLEKWPQVKDVGGIIRNTWDAEIVAELQPSADDVVLDKTRYSAFYDTDLATRLIGLAVDTVVVCGVTTNICVESTVRDAFFRDIRVIVPSDATAAVTRELHEGSLRNVDFGFGAVTTVAALERALAGLLRPQLSGPPSS